MPLQHPSSLLSQGHKFVPRPGGWRASGMTHVKSMPSPAQQMQRIYSRGQCIGMDRCCQAHPELANVPAEPQQTQCPQVTSISCITGSASSQDETSRSSSRPWYRPSLQQTLSCCITASGVCVLARLPPQIEHSLPRCLADTCVESTCPLSSTPKEWAGQYLGNPRCSQSTVGQRLY